MPARVLRESESGRDRRGRRRPIVIPPAACASVAPVAGAGEAAGPGWLRAIVGTRLAQFVLIGGAIFALTQPQLRADEVRVSPARLTAMAEQEARRVGVPALGPTELKALETRAIQDEILYREALRLGLAESDGIVRERLIQKVLFLAEDLGGASREPTEEDLRAFFEATKQRWSRPASLRFVHVFAAHADAVQALRAKLDQWSAPSPDAAPPFGEAFPISRSVVAPVAEIEARYGAEFAAAAALAPLGEWTEPIASKYGFHLVRVSAREEGRPATYEEQREELKLDYLIARREQATAAYLARALPRYRVSIDDRRVDALSALPRTSARSSASAED